MPRARETTSASTAEKLPSVGSPRSSVYAIR